MCADIFRGRFSLKHMTPERRMIIMLVIATLPLALVYFLKDFFFRVATDDDIIIEGFCFLFTSILLFLCDIYNKKHTGRVASNMRYSDAIAVGLLQAIAPLPGISRSGSTISAGVISGLDRSFAVTFSFILGIPAVLGANILELKDLKASPIGLSPGVMAVGFFSALIFGIISIKLVRYIAKNKSFLPFVLYTCAAGIITILLGIFYKA